MAKMRALTRLWDEITAERYGVTDPKARRLRYGVQVNSLGLTEAQPENNIQRIVLEMLGVTLSRDARARAIQLPAWNEALGLPRPWDQQWSLRMQQVLAYESDLLEYPDLFEGSVVVEGLVDEIATGARAELDKILDTGGVVAAVEIRLSQVGAGRLAGRAARSDGDRRRRRGRCQPLHRDRAVAIDRRRRRRDRAGRPGGRGRHAIASIRAWRADRDEAAATAAIERLRVVARTTENLMEATLACVRAGVTTGEWAGALRAEFGEYRAPTGLAGASGVAADVATIASRVRETAAELGSARLRILVGKPGLDGHSNGAEQIAMRARDAGFEVVYQGIRLTPAQIVAAAIEEDVDIVGLSVLSGSHLAAVPAVLDGLRVAGSKVPVVVGGIIPDDDAVALRAAGVARVFTPKDFALTEIVAELVTVVRESNGLTG